MVLSGQEQPPWPLSLLYGVSSSVDAYFVRGHRYVVGASRSFATAACSVTDAAGTPCPADAREPVEEGLQGADPPMGPATQTVAVAGVITALAAAVHLLRRRRKATP